MEQNNKIEGDVGPSACKSGTEKVHKPQTSTRMYPNQSLFPFCLILGGSCAPVSHAHCSTSSLKPGEHKAPSEACSPASIHFFSLCSLTAKIPQLLVESMLQVPQSSNITISPLCFDWGEFIHSNGQVIIIFNIRLMHCWLSGTSPCWLHICLLNECYRGNSWNETMGPGTV